MISIEKKFRKIEKKIPGFFEIFFAQPPKAESRGAKGQRAFVGVPTCFSFSLRFVLLLARRKWMVP